MSSKTLGKGLVMTLSLAIALTTIAMSPIWSVACTPASNTHLDLAAKAETQPTEASNVVLEWNQQALALVLQPASALAPIQQIRVMAIFQVAVHDAVNGITGEYETYLSPDPAPANASPEAAAIAAAHQVLRTLFPGSQASLDDLYTTSLAAHGLLLTDPGIAFGNSAANAMLAARADDHSAQAQFSYDAPNAGDPGVWVRLNNAPAQLPGWGAVTPFVMRSASQFLPGPPPALDSDQYAKDYNEIIKIGVSSGSTRSTEQTQIALFWRSSPAAIWNPVITQVVQSRDLSLSDQARLFGLFYLAAADSSITCWKAKYQYNAWRPQLAIGNGDADGNDATVGQPGWLPLLATPPHPEYPSGHSMNSSAMANILISEFGDKQGVPITVTLTGITRHWDSFSEAVQEVIDARVYSGIHFRNSDEVGARAGRQVAQFVSHHALRKSK